MRSDKPCINLAELESHPTLSFSFFCKEKKLRQTFFLKCNPTPRLYSLLFLSPSSPPGTTFSIHHLFLIWECRPHKRKKKGRKEKGCQKTSYYLCAPEIPTEKGGNFEEGTFFFCVPQSIYLVPNSEFRSDFRVQFFLCEGILTA